MLKIEEIWPELEVEEAIGQGSYGVVYRCVKKVGDVDEYCAIKVISVPQNDVVSTGKSIFGMTIEETKKYYKEIVDDFGKEIQILESLKGNKNIVGIQDSKIVEKEDGIGWQIFIKMDLMIDFETYISRNKLTEKDIIKLGCDLCDALSICASKNIIHRDIKPENIFVDKYGNFRLGDFGVAKQLEKTEASMSRKGTYNYMAPEVLSAKHYDSRADIYSLALVMYKLLNDNQMPFVEKTGQIVGYREREAAFNRRINGEKIPPISNCNEKINSAILRACEFNPDDRFHDVKEFRAALDGIYAPIEVKADNKKDKAEKKDKKENKKSGKKKGKVSTVISIVVTVALVVACIGVVAFKDELFKSELPDIKYSGMCTGIYTVDGVDFCVGGDAGDSLPPGLFYRTQEGPESITDDYCTADFTIIDNRIYYAAYEADLIEVDEEGNEIDPGNSERIYECKVVDTNGKHGESLFFYGKNSGKVVYADSEYVYYTVYDNECSNIVLYKFNISEGSGEKVSNTDKSINDIVYVDGFIILSYCGMDSKDGSESEVICFSLDMNTLISIEDTYITYYKDVKNIFRKDDSSVYIKNTETDGDQKEDYIMIYTPSENTFEEITKMEEGMSVSSVSGENIYLNKLVTDSENKSFFEYFICNAKSGKIMTCTPTFESDRTKMHIKQGDSYYDCLLFGSERNFIYAQYDNEELEKATKTDFYYSMINNGKTMSVKSGVTHNGVYCPVAIGANTILFAQKDKDGLKNLFYINIKDSDVKKDIGKCEIEDVENTTTSYYYVYTPYSTNNNKTTDETTSATTKVTNVSSYTPGRYKVMNLLNVRTGPGTGYTVKSFSQLSANAQQQILNNNYGKQSNTLVPGCICDVYSVSGEWGKTVSGWINLKYCQKIG